MRRGQQNYHGLGTFRGLSGSTNGNLMKSCPQGPEITLTLTSCGVITVGSSAFNDVSGSDSVTRVLSVTLRWRLRGTKEVWQSTSARCTSPCTPCLTRPSYVRAAGGCFLSLPDLSSPLHWHCDTLLPSLHGSLPCISCCFSYYLVHLLFHSLNLYSRNWLLSQALQTFLLFLKNKIFNFAIY